MRCTLCCTAMLLAPEWFMPRTPRSECVAPEEVKEGFVSLFDGKTLDGWQGAVKGYTIEDGAMVCKPGGNVYTNKEYANFVLRFEFKLPPGGNNGVGIRTPVKGDAGLRRHGNPGPRRRAPEVQGPPAVPGPRLDLRRRAGQTRTPEAGRPVEQRGDRRRRPHIKVTLNGTVITDADLSKIDKTIDTTRAPGPAQRQGLHRLARPRRSGGLPQRADQGTAVGGMAGRRHREASGSCRRRADSSDTEPPTVGD